jgi:hypothetical protein
LKVKEHIFFFTLSFLLACCYVLTVVDIPKGFIFSSTQTIELSGSHGELGVELKEGSYFLMVKRPIQPFQKVEVRFNEIIIPFSYSRKSKENQRDYYLIEPGHVRENNLIKFDFDKTPPSSVTINLKNFRKSLWGGRVWIFHKPIFLLGFNVRMWAVVFVVGYLFLLAFYLFLTELTKEGGRWLILPAVAVVTVFTLVSINNLLDIFPYAIIITLPFFLLCILILSLALLIVIITAQKPRYGAERLFDDRASDSVDRWFIAPVFLGLIVALVLIRLVLVLGNRVPMGHDTFQYMQLQYILFFNEPALHGAVPQWLPFLTHGSVSNFWVIFCQGILTSVLVPVASFFKNINFYYIFQAGLLFDEIILLFGCVMLAKRYLKSAASIVFVTSSIIFTTISSTQIWWDFHLIYLFPLTLYCFDRALRDISAKYLFLAGLFSVGMMLGNPPYCLSLFGFTMVVFGLAVLGFFPTQSLACLKKFALNFKLRHLLAIVIPCVLFVIILLFLKHGTGNTVPYSANRSANWQVNGLKDVLSYGGSINLTKYIGFISRGTNNLDNTVYAGLLLVPFMLMTLSKVRSRLSYAFGSTAVMMALFSAGIIVPVVFYYVFPFAKYYRHIGLISPLVKFFAVFYAGFGFDQFWQSLKHLKNKSSLNTYPEINLSLLVLLLIMLFILTSVSIQRFGGFKIFDFPLWASVKTESQLYVSDSQISGLMTQLVIISGLFSILLTTMLWWPRRAVLIGCILVSLHLIDVGSFKAELEIKRLPRVDKKIIYLFDVCNYSFSNNRHQNYLSNSRFAQIMPYLLYDDKNTLDLNQPADKFGKYGVQYWSIDTFLFFDPISHIFSTQRWEKGVDDFYKVWTPASGGVPHYAGFPMPQTTAFNNLCGHSSPKLQLFSRIHVLPNEKYIADMLANPDFKGYMLLTPKINSNLSIASDACIIDSQADINLPDNNDRISNADIFVQEFSFDKLRLQVNNESQNDVVLYYADAWHPEWHAYVNGKRSYVFKTNLAYKSVIIPPGRSEVVFQFGDAISKFLFNGMIAIGIFVFFGLFYCMFVGLSEKDEKLSSGRIG